MPTLLTMSLTVNVASCLIISSTPAIFAAPLGWSGWAPSVNCVILNGLFHIVNVPCISHRSLYICEADIFTAARPLIPTHVSKLPSAFIIYLKRQTVYISAPTWNDNNFRTTERSCTKCAILLCDFPVKLLQLSHVTSSRFVWKSISDKTC